MSYFRNVQNNGVWQPENTYTFEVDERNTHTDDETGSTFVPIYELTGITCYNYGDGVGGIIGLENYDPPVKDMHYACECAGYYGGGRGIITLTGWQCLAFSQFKDTGFNLVYDGDSLIWDKCNNISPSQESGTILFNNNSETFEGGYNILDILNTEILGDGWTKYTVKIKTEAEIGEYYLKGREYLYYSFLI